MASVDHRYFMLSQRGGRKKAGKVWGRMLAHFHMQWRSSERMLKRAERTRQLKLGSDFQNRREEETQY
jgi:hypothetical protein